MDGSQLQSPAKPDGVVADILQGTKTDGNANSPMESEVVKMVMGMLTKGKAWKGNWSKNFERWWNLWESNHYYGRKAHTLSQAIVNQIWSSLETFIAHITEGLPEPLARPRTPEMKGKAKLVSKWLVYEADRNNLGQEIEHPVRSAVVTGAGWFSVEWDEKASKGKGDVAINPVDEKYIFVSPGARNLHEALWLIEAKNVPRDYVLKLYPEKGPSVPPGVMDGTLENARIYTESNNSDSASPNWMQVTTTTGGQSAWVNSSSSEGLKKSDFVTFIKAYVKQDDGAMRLVVIANGIVMQDGLSPYDDDDFPYVVVNVLPTLDTIQGRGLVQFIEGLQYILNNSISYLLDQQRFSSDPMLIVNAANLEDGQLIDNSPGAVLPDSSQNGQGYQWLQAPGFNQAWIQIQELVKNYMDGVLGRVEILQGEHPAGVNTLGGLEVLRDEANIRLRKHTKWVKASLKRVYLLTLSRLRQYCHDERMIRLTDQYGEDQFYTMNQAGGIGADGAMEVDKTIPDDAEFDIEFGKESAGGKQARLEQALALAGTPAEDGFPMVDRQWVLDQAEIEEAPEIMQRIAALQQQQAQAEQQAALAADPAAQEQAAAEAAQPNPLDNLVEILSGMK